MPRVQFMKYDFLKILAVVFCLANICAAADVTIGDSPVLEMSTVNGGVFKLSEHRGHLVAVVFFTSSTDSFASEIKEALSVYGSKGFEAVGICSINTPQKIQTQIRDHIIDFPVKVDPIHNTANLWGVKGTKIYLFDTDG